MTPIGQHDAAPLIPEVEIWRVKIGDVVTLKSGSQNMVIVAVDTPLVTVAWHVENSTIISSATLPSGALDLEEEAP